MRPKVMKILERCIADGIAMGYARANKDDGHPSQDAVSAEIAGAIDYELNEWFVFADSGIDACVKWRLDGLSEKELYEMLTRREIDSWDLTRDQLRLFMDRREEWGLEEVMRDTDLDGGIISCSHYWRLAHYELDDLDRALIATAGKAMARVGDGEQITDVMDESDLIDAVSLLLKVCKERGARV